MQAPYQYGKTYTPARNTCAPCEHEVRSNAAGVRQIEALAEQVQDISFDTHQPYDDRSLEGGIAFLPAFLLTAIDGCC